MGARVFTFLLGALAALLTVALPGCVVSTEPSKTGRVLSWWSKHGEVEALSALFTLFSRKHPEQMLIYDPLENSDAVRETVQRYFWQGRPPVSFQANGGWDLLSWVFFNETDDSQSKLEPIDTLAKAWRDDIPAPVLASVSCKGHVYGVPLDIHRLNTLFFNRRLFEAAGIELPLGSLSDLFAALAVLRAQGTTWPFAIGTRDPWTLSLVLLENLLVAQDQGKFYRRYLLGQTSAEANDVALGQALRDLSTLLSFSDVAKRRFLKWDDAVYQVTRGEAAVTIMGDWALGLLGAEGGPDGAVSSMPMPGTQDVFVFTTDTFSLPKGAPNREGAIDFLELVGSREGQDVFNPPKGSISPRGYVDGMMPEPGPQAETSLAFQQAAASDNLVPATAVLVPPEFMDKVNTVMGRFADPSDQSGSPSVLGNESVVRATLRNYHDLLGPSPCQP